MNGRYVSALMWTWRRLDDASLANWVLKRILAEGQDFRLDKVEGIGPIKAQFELERAGQIWCANTSPRATLVSNSITASMSKYPHTDLGVQWQTLPRGLNLNSLGFSWDDRFMESKSNVDPVVKLVSDVFVKLECGYGLAFHYDEWFEKDWMEARGPSGKVRKESIALPPERGLKDLYWANFFGPPYVQLFSRDKIESCPTFQTKLLGNDSFVLLTTELPNDWSRPEVLSSCNRAKNHLNAGAFFDKSNPDKAPTPPHWPLPE